MTLVEMEGMNGKGECCEGQSNGQSLKQVVNKTGKEIRSGLDEREEEER